MNISDPAAWPTTVRDALAAVLLAAADDDFLIGHRNSDWTGLAPMLEEDIAFSSIAQDEVAHAREWYQLVAEISRESPDVIAYGRPAGQRRCAALVYMDDGFDWACLIARQFFYDHFDALRLECWRGAAYAPLASIANRIAAEERFHVHHVNDWLKRLSRGSADARQRMQSALDRLWPLTPGLFEETDGAALAAQDRLLPRLPAGSWDGYVTIVSTALSLAGLRPPAAITPSSAAVGGRRGKHGPELETVLAELTEVYQTEPGVSW